MPRLRRGAAAPEFLAGTQPEHALKERIGFFEGKAVVIRVQRCPVIMVK